MALTGRLIALALVGVILAPLSAAAVLIWLAVLAVAVGLDLALAARIADLRLRREASTPVRLGESGESRLQVTNAGRRPLQALVADAWVPSAGAHPAQQRLAIPPGGAAVLVTALTPTRRGRRDAATVAVRAHGPLGLAGRQRRIGVPGAIQVLPAFGSRRFLPEKLARLRQIDGAVLLRRRGQGSEFDSLRAYVPGDDVRAIDWRATARSRDTVVRTWRPERDRHILLMIDTGRLSAGRIGDATRLDSALDACLLVGAVAGRAGDRVGLVAADVEVRAQLGRTAGHDILPRLVEVLTPVQPRLVETDPLLLAGEVARRGARRSLVMLFAGLDAASDGLLIAARAIAVRHQLVVASVADPRLAELAAARSDLDDVYAAAAAERASTQRRAVADQLRRLGAVVVDAPAERFGSAVADAYLDLKARGLL